MKRAILLTRTGAMTEVSFCRARENVGCKRYMRRTFWRSHRKEASKVIAEDLEYDNTFDLFDLWRQDEAILRDIQAIREKEERLRIKREQLWYKMEDIRDQLYAVNEELENVFDDIEELTQYRLASRVA